MPERNFTQTFLIAMSHQIFLVSFGAFTILMFLIKKNSASKTVSVFFLIPPASAVMAWLFLGEILLDIELDIDEPFSEDLCGSCTACIDACPTQALDEYILDSSKCISYLTIEHRGEFFEGQDDLDGWIYGCDVCQEVCPWNISFSKVSDESYFEPRNKIQLPENN